MRNVALTANYDASGGVGDASSVARGVEGPRASSLAGCRRQCGGVIKKAAVAGDAPEESSDRAGP